ncbi:MAG: hypothetical protein DMC57_06100 [Verrucomicrobia bacterium]|nr:MAG: hypothetical protein DMC57_06100 [Verrucomicrobiota bacterium]
MSSEYASPARTATSLTVFLLKIRDFSIALGMTKKALSPDKSALWRPLSSLGVRRHKNRL